MLFLLGFRARDLSGAMAGIGSSTFEFVENVDLVVIAVSILEINDSDQIFLTIC